MLSFKFFCSGMYFHVSMDKIFYCIIIHVFLQCRSSYLVALPVAEHLKCFPEKCFYSLIQKHILLSQTGGKTFGVDSRDCVRLCQHLSSSLSIRQSSRCPTALLSFYFCHSHDTSAVLHCQCVGEPLLHVQCVWEVLEKRRHDSFHLISMNQFVWVFKNDSLIRFSHHTRSRL